MLYSSIAYCQDKRVCKHCHMLGETHSFRDDLTNTEGYVTVDDKTQSIVISFKGTDPRSMKNWLIDLEVYQVQYKNISQAMVHSGFYVAYTLLQPKVQKIVRDLRDRYGHRHIKVTGHSLGGALALLCYLDLISSGYDSSTIELYTFGQPRVGNKAFNAYVYQQMQKYWRVVNMNDIVSQLPLQIQGFSHSGTEVWYYTPKEYVICSHWQKKESCQQIDSFSLDAHLFYLGYPISRLC